MASTISSTIFSLPEPLRKLFSRFPLHTYPEISSPYHTPRVTSPTLWVHPPRSQLSTKTSKPQDELYASEREGDLLSSDVECLKWQAYLALRYLKDITVRWDVPADGAVDGRLPNLHVPILPASQGIEAGIKDDGEGQLLAAHLIPEWVDGKQGDVGALEGYVDEAARDESRTWVSLLEGNVHAALLAFQPPSHSLISLLLTPYQASSRPIETILTPPPAPLTGWSSLIRPYGAHLDLSSIELKYKEAIAALSDRLGTDRWFLGSSAPTALDALAFAYLHVILNSKDDTLRFEASRRVNLVAWEQRVSRDVRAAFKSYTR